MRNAKYIPDYLLSHCTYSMSVRKSFTFYALDYLHFQLQLDPEILQHAFARDLHEPKYIVAACAAVIHDIDRTRPRSRSACPLSIVRGPLLVDRWLLTTDH